MINQALDHIGLEATQMFATICDDITRHTPEDQRFKTWSRDVTGKRRGAKRTG